MRSDALQKSSSLVGRILFFLFYLLLTYSQCAILVTRMNSSLQFRRRETTSREPPITKLDSENLTDSDLTKRYLLAFNLDQNSPTQTNDTSFPNRNPVFNDSTNEDDYSAGEFRPFLVFDIAAARGIDTDHYFADVNESVELFLDEDLFSNATNMTTTDLPKVIPVCKVGDKNCTRCRNISPLCHYLYSEKRCMYFNSTHASKAYECGKRWFPVDRNEGFFVTLAFLLIVSGGVVLWLSSIHYGMMGRAVSVIPPDEMIELRQLVDEVRRRRQSSSAEAIEGTQNQKSSKSSV